MFNEKYITDVKQRKLNVTFIGIGMLLGCLLTGFTFVSLIPADAKGSTIDEVRRSQSEVYRTAAEIKAALNESNAQIDYILASMHDNAKKLDFQGE